MIYNEKLTTGNIEIKKENLFAIICYKNLFPGDFRKSQYHEGYLSILFSRDSKKMIVRKKREEYQNDISNIKYEKNLEIVKKDKRINKLASKYLIYGGNYYFFEGIKQKTTSDYKTTADFIAAAKKEIDSVSNKDLDFYDKLKILERNTNYLEEYNAIKRSHTMKINTFNEEILKIEKKISKLKIDSLANLLDSISNFDEYNIQLTKYLEFSLSEQTSNPLDDAKIEKDKNTLNPIEDTETKKDKNTLNLLENKKLQIQETPLINLFFAYDGKRYEKLLKYFIVNGHITENYLDYLSLFLGDAQQKDFLISLITSEPLSYDYHLSDPSKTIKKMKSEDFTKDSALNFSIVRELFIGKELEHI